MRHRPHRAAAWVLSASVVVLAGSASAVAQGASRLAGAAAGQSCASRVRALTEMWRDIMPRYERAIGDLRKRLRLLDSLRCEALVDLGSARKECRLALDTEVHVLEELQEQHTAYQEMLAYLEGTLDELDHDGCLTRLTPAVPGASEPAPTRAVEPDLTGVWTGTWRNSFGAGGTARFTIAHEPGGTLRIRGEPGFGIWMGTRFGSRIVCKSAWIEQYAFSAIITIEGPDSLSVAYDGTGDHPRGTAWTGTVTLTR